MPEPLVHDLTPTAPVAPAPAAPALVTPDVTAATGCPFSGAAAPAAADRPGAPMELADRVADPAHRAISLALWVSAIRCTLVYVLLPIAGPALGLTSSPALPLWLALHAVGLFTSGRALRRAVLGRQRGLTGLSAALLALNLLSLALR